MITNIKLRSLLREELTFHEWNLLMSNADVERIVEVCGAFLDKSEGDWCRKFNRKTEEIRIKYFHKENEFKKHRILLKSTIQDEIITAIMAGKGTMPGVHFTDRDIQSIDED